MLPIWTLTQALRGFRVGRGTMMLAFGVMSLVMAAGTVSFSVVDAIAIRPLPYAAPTRLVDISVPSPTAGARLLASPADFVAWSDRGLYSLNSIAAARLGIVRLRLGGTLTQVSTSTVTPNIFDVLGVSPSLGRLFKADDGPAGADLVAVLGHDFWVSRFSADRTVVGRQVEFEDGPREVIGVLPDGVWYPITAGRAPDVYLPHAFGAADSLDNHCCLFVVGRLSPRFSVQQMRTEIQRLSSAVVVPLQEEVVGSNRASMLLVLAAVGLLMLLACAGTGTALLGRATSRSPEFAIRAALGASRGQLATCLLLEAVGLAALAAVASLAISIWGVALSESMLPSGFTRVSTIALNTRVLVVLSVTAIVSGLAFGTAPAWFVSRLDFVGPMKASGGVIGARHHRTLVGLLVTSIALVSIVLVATTLVVATFVKLSTTDLGFARRNVMTVGYEQPLGSLTRSDWPAASETIRADVLRRVRTLPGVVDAAISVGGSSPLSGAKSTVSFFIPGFGAIRPEDSVQYDRVTPEYFRTMGIELIRGRTFTLADRLGTPPVMVINDVAAKQWFVDSDPVGRVAVLGEPTTIVGVSRAVRFEGPEGELRPAIYLAASQSDVAKVSGTAIGLLLVRTRNDPRALAASIQSAIRPALAVEPGLAAFIDDDFRRLTETRRFNAEVMSMFGVFALMVGATTIYGTAAFVAAQELRGLALRMALGATPFAIRRAVLRQSLVWIGAGLLLGIVGSWAASTLMRSFVFGVRPTEPLVYLAVSGAVASLGLGATIIPAIRASRVDPVLVLRQ